MQIPELRPLNGHMALYVGSQPFLMLGLQWNCDSCYTEEMMMPLFPEARKMGCNTAALPLYWESIEPEEGVFDFSILQKMLDGARANDLKIVIIWFGAYKNADNHYSPEWVKDHPERFRHAVRKDGTVIHNIHCPTCGETLAADRRALSNVFQYLKEHDEERTVILVQINNEVGIWGSDRCYCPECNRRFEENDYMTKYGERASEAFSAECFLAFNDEIARACKEIYPLPCYMNAWLAKKNPMEHPGDYPSGGPTWRVLDIYRDKRKALDFVAPDIYEMSAKDFNEISGEYVAAGNPLFVAEHATGAGSRAELNVYYAFCRHNAIGFDGWAIDCSYPAYYSRPLVSNVHQRWSDDAWELLESYLPIRQAMIPIAKNLGTDNLRWWVQEDDTSEIMLHYDQDDLVMLPVFFTNRHSRSRGICIRLSAKQFLIIGVGCLVSIRHCNGSVARIRKLERGRYEGEQWIWQKNIRWMRTHPLEPIRVFDPGVYRVTLE